MLTKSKYSVKEMILWTRWEILGFFIYAIIVALLYYQAGYTFLKVPWTPVAVVGTAVAFIVGFQNNSAYGRIWEARKIWGGIVNASRTWGMKIQDMISAEHEEHSVSKKELKAIRKTLVHRHIAWLTALRHAMRQPRKWEVLAEHQTNREWSKMIHIPEKVTSLKDDLLVYLDPQELEYSISKGNRSTTILFLQSAHLRKLKERGLLWEFSFLELENLLQELFTLQGQSERIKNFPYPRQYASLSIYFVWIFLILLPLAIIPEFDKIGESLSESFPVIGSFFLWAGVPFCAQISWMFHTMERIGRVGENPFEGSPNDVPISTISRGIEIDLRQQLNEEAILIPGQFPEQRHVQM
jgi:putative membrane protein